ncbi:MAG: hypothetical protein WC222_03790 [Parachlamydiales bacterium]|jgi:hypothetical protein
MSDPIKKSMEAKDKTRLIPLTDWPKHHPWPPLGGLRHLVFNAAINGFDKVVRRIGRRVLLDEASFFQWVKANNPISDEVDNV